ncbi:MAG: radical SAM protein [Thermodesulfobacteriota bacterium]
MWAKDGKRRSDGLIFILNLEEPLTMGTCRHCHTRDRTISDVVGYCAGCIRDHFDRVWPEIEAVHHRSRAVHGLPARPPNAADGITCPICFRKCRIPEGGLGYCGVRSVEGGRLKGGRPLEGNLYAYHDPLPTNCVADFVCPAGGKRGYPTFSVCPGPEYGFRNLAVFYHACSFNCLYCQNSHFRDRTLHPETVTAQALADEVTEGTTCICYFGGDPGPQVLHALEASRLALAAAKGRVLRICWETNGTVRPPFLMRMAEQSLRSGGCIKFDIKAWNDEIHHALCAASNSQTLENVRRLSSLIAERSDPPLMVASTLLVPGYVDELEVSHIARFLAGLSRDIPYRLLAFYPSCVLRDLPNTSQAHARRCLTAAEKAGLKRVSMGNVGLLGLDYT